jgi:hypothetical protein
MCLVAECRHESLKYVGEQKTDDGVNRYYTCANCGELLVVTPANTVIGIKSRQIDPEGS